jgi:hypothetical protein
MRKDIKARIRRTAEMIAQSAGATARVELGIGGGSYPVTINDRALTAEMVPTLKRVAGDANVSVSELLTPSEDFSFYQQKVPGLFVFLGVVPKGQDPATAPRNHSPSFFADEAALPVGVRTLANLAVDWLQAHPVKPIGRPMLHLVSILSAVLLQQGPAYDVVIRGGRVLDGTGNPSIYADVGIKGRSASPRSVICRPSPPDGWSMPGGNTSPPDSSPSTSTSRARCCADTAPSPTSPRRDSPRR